MPLNNNTTEKTRIAYHERRLGDFFPSEDDADERELRVGHTVEAKARELVAAEDELIWAWSRDPTTDLTQVEARDRAQSHDYGRFNVSQSSLSRKLRKLDESMMHGEVIRLDGFSPFTDTEAYDAAIQYAPEYVDRQQEKLAEHLCDRHALAMFRDANERTPDWAQDRHPDLDPNLGRQYAQAQAEDSPDTLSQIFGELHEPHE